MKAKDSNKFKGDLCGTYFMDGCKGVLDTIEKEGVMSFYNHLLEECGTQFETSGGRSLVDYGCHSVSRRVRRAGEVVRGFVRHRKSG